MPILKIQLQSASSLDIKSGSGNVFCKMLVGSEKAKSRRSKSQNPVWEETFCFTRVNPASDQLMIQVFDRVRLGKTEPLGWTAIPLKDLPRGMGKPQSVLLQGVKSGTLSVTLTGVDFGIEETREATLQDVDSIPASIKSSIPDGTEWHLSPETVAVKEESQLGKGAFGVVYKGTIFGKSVAIKKLNKQELSPEVMEEFVREVGVMCRIRHPNVVLFMGACTDPGHLAIVTELLPRGSMEALLQNQALTFFQKFSMAKDVALALNWLHCSQGLLHLDLKPANLLVDDNWNVKLADFGLASLKNNIQSGQLVGTPWFMAPEILLQKSFDEKADVYSFGIVLWQMFTNQLQPYGDRIKTLSQLVELVARKHERPPIPDDCPIELKKTIEMCWAGEPSQRPSFQELINNNSIDNIVLSRVFRPDQGLGRECWCRLCEGKVKASVSWEDFLKALLQTIGVDSVEAVEERCLQALFKNDAAEVTCEKFSQMLDWIGPLTIGKSMLVRIKQLLARPDFFGPLTGKQAEAILRRYPPGFYLLRFSVSQSGDYAIAAVDEKRAISHFKIQKISGKFVAGEAKFDTIEDALKDPPPQLKKVMKNPCPDAPYRDLFSSEYVESTVYLRL